MIGPHAPSIGDSAQESVRRIHHIGVCKEQPLSGRFLTGDMQRMIFAQPARRQRGHMPYPQP